MVVYSNIKQTEVLFQLSRAADGDKKHLAKKSVS